MADTDWIEIGRIVSPQGVRGEVRVYPSSDFPERFLDPGPRWLKRPQRPDPEAITLVQGRSLDGKGLYIVKLEGIDDRTQAETLRGCALLVPAEDRPDLEEGEFYAADLMGLRVILQATGAEIGLVTDLYEAGNDLLEVTLHPSASQSEIPDTQDQPKDKTKSRKVLVPFVEAIVPVVDLAQGCLYLTPPEGLIDP